MSGMAEVSPKYLAEVASSAIPVGYKQTEVGLIPEDWLILTLGDIAELTSSKRIFESDYVKSGVPFYRGQEISSLLNGSVIENVIYISQAKFNELAARFGAPKAGEILITAVGTLGNSFLVESNDPFYFKDGNLIWLRKIKNCQPKYLIKQLNYNKNRVLECAIGSSQKALTMVSLSPLLIPVPSKIEEQIAIANALSDVDALISELEKLIAKKQAIKTATMQQLLTGRTRLPQFALHEDGTPKGTKPSALGEIPEDWEMSKIGDFAPLQRGFDLPSSNRVDGQYPVVYSNGIANTHCHFQVKGPGVVTGRSGTLGKVHYVEDDYWPHNTSLWVTKFNGTDPKYIYFVFTYLGFERFASGSGVPTLNRNDAHSYKVVIPSTEAEQTAIATILSDMDEEIQALEQRLGKTRQIKQGMMQELLTGKTRLVQGIKND